MWYGPPKPFPAEPEIPRAPGRIQGPPAPTVPSSSRPSIELASTSETVEELRRRLGKELYRLELDLENGGRIAGKPCDCLSKKHRFGLEATAEELMSYEHNPVHGQVIDWLNKKAPTFEPEQIAKHDPEYYRAMIPEVRMMRKQVMGTESLASLLNSQEKVKALELQRKASGK